MGNYENELFKTANKLRGKIPPSDYKFYVLPLVFMRYMSEKKGNTVWNEIVEKSDDEKIASLLDSELIKILPQFSNIANPYEDMYSNSNLPARTIKDLINLINEIDLKNSGGKIDYLGQIYEYFIGNFAATEGNRGGEFFTPPSVVNLLVSMLNPTEGVVYDPACGTGGMFIQSSRYSKSRLKFLGQEQNCKTILLAYMNGVLHGLDMEIRNGDTLLDDCFKELKADYVISNPPFNMKEWGAEQLNSEDPRVFGMVNKNNANYMWIQHFIYHLKPNGKAGFVISNGALTSSNEADLFTRRKMLERNIIDCVVQLPYKMFIGTAIPSALIFIDMNRKDTDKILFIDASKYGVSVSKTQKIITEDSIECISKLYKSFKENRKIKYNVKGYSWLTEVNEIVNNGCKLMPSIYTGVEEIVVNKEENEKAINLLKESLKEQIKISNNLANVLLKGLN
ncbi:type I restriction-modification system subunit M [Lacrimispora sp. NSJ-141]|uniref:site-specific DNA-methyltransferase (adenine-specific) n=1 Tax=Lientehia hominis TaxID=2897778 RepID=A0AAP2RJW4_9FIRM|nr:N-6 DNA methylase [Lientehia hominis]MCD2492965.1 type I restriction-modification system subunit M [Lientehia hominis]